MLPSCARQSLSSLDDHQFVVESLHGEFRELTPDTAALISRQLRDISAAIVRINVNASLLVLRAAPSISN